MLFFDEVQFLVKSHSFFLPLFPQANPSLGKSFVPFQAQQLPKLSLSRHINNIFSTCLFLHSEPKLSKSKELNDQRIKVKKSYYEGKYDLLYQIQSKNMKMTWKIRLFIFNMICNFFSNVMALQFCK